MSCYYFLYLMKYNNEKQKNSWTYMKLKNVYFLSFLQ